MVFLSSALALFIPFGLSVFAWLLRGFEAGRKTSPADLAQREKLGARMNTRFFLGANSALALIGLALLLVPCASALGTAPAREGKSRAAVAIAVVAAIAGIGLLYASRKGDTRWLSTYRDVQEGT